MRLLEKTKEGILLAYPTPILARQYHDTEFNNRIKELIIKTQKEDEGIVRSVRGGWHSKNSFLTDHKEELKPLIDRIINCSKEINKYYYPDVDKYRINITAGWANVLPNGGYHKLHAHMGNTWSGVYYVEVGEESNTAKGSEGEFGNIEFPDPRANATEGMMPKLGLSGPTLSITPKPQMLLMFPSWLKHNVNPFRGAKERITIAFNLRLAVAQNN